MTRLRTALLGTLSLSLVALGAIAAPATPASAALIPNDGTYGILNPQYTGASVVSEYAQFEFTFDWAVPDSSEPGDTLQLQLPAALDEASFESFTLNDPATSETVATASIDDNGLVTLTLTDYVLSHNSVTGGGQFYLRLDRSTLPSDGSQGSIDIFGNQVTITRDVGTVGPTTPGKFSWWPVSQGISTTLNPDGSLVNPEGPHAVFAISVRNGETEAGDWSTATISDDLDAAMEYCDPDTGAAHDNLAAFLVARDVNGGRWGAVPVPAGVAMTTSCDGNAPSFTITRDDTVPDAIEYRVQYETVWAQNAQQQPVFTDTAGAEQVGFKDSYSNDAAVVYDGGFTDTVAASHEVDGQGGYGSGVWMPAIDIEKYDGSWEGVQFGADGADVTPAPALEPVNQPVGDHDEPTGPTLDAAAPHEVRFTVTNIGIEDIRDVVVTDATTSGPAITDIVCDASALPDGAVVAASGSTVTFPSAWVLPVGASFDCVGTLPAMGAGAAYIGDATVTGVSVLSATNLTDNDLWHARTAEPATPVDTAPPTTAPPTAPPVATPPAVTPPAAQPAAPVGGTPAQATLPRTGIEPAGWALMLAALGLLGGGAALALRTKRSGR